jgi:hypothetical protein
MAVTSSKCDNAPMTESESGKSESPESSGKWSRWCFIVDTAGRIVHTAETPPAAELPAFGVDLDSPAACPAPRSSSATMTRPSFDTPWWTVAVEEADRHEAGRIALALVEDDRATYGLPEPGFETPAAPTPAPVALGDLDQRLGDWYEEAGNLLAGDDECADGSCCKGASAPVYSRTSITLTEEGTDRERELVRRSEEFARVRTYRGYLNHATEIAAPTEDVRILVEQAEFWQGEFAETHNRLTETIADLREELDQYRDEEEPEELAAGEYKQCHEIPCSLPVEELTFEFQEATWEVTFDLNGTYVGMRYGDYLKGEPLAAGAEPVVVTPDRGDYPGWFTVAVRSTNSTSAVELARATLREREGITGDVLAVIAGESTVEESGASEQQLAWGRQWAKEQLAVTEAHAAEFRTCLDRLGQAGAAA